MVKGFNPQHIYSLRFFRNLAYNKIADLPADVFYQLTSLQEL